MQRLWTVTSLDVSAVAGHHAMPAVLFFFFFFRCLSQIYTMKVFKRTCPFQKDIRPEVSSVIKVCTIMCLNTGTSKTI